MADRRTWAILIGIDKYRHLPRLENSVADAELVKQVLMRDFSIHPRMIRLVTDRHATRNALLRLINDTIPRRWDVRPSDQLFFFFAGHADVALKKSRRTWYLAPIDARPKSDGAPDWQTVITGGEIRRLEETFSGAHILNILDACYSGMQFAAEVPRDRKIRVKSAYAIVAGRAGDPVLDEGGEGHEGHSIFTESLVTALTGWGRFEVGEGGSFKARDLDIFIEKDVPRQIRKRALHPVQRPFGFALKGNIQGDQFTFRPTAPRLPPSVTQPLLNEQVNIRKAAVAGLSSLLPTVPSNLVLDALRRLSRDESPAVRTEVTAQLARVTGPASVQILLQLLTDPDQRVAIAAVRMLAKTSDADRASVVRALNAFRAGADIPLRRTIDFSLAQLGDVRSVRAIIRDLPTEQGSIRREIIDVLRHLSGSAMSRAELADLLQSLLRSVEWRKRRAASEAIGELGLEVAVGTLAKLATTPSEHFMVRCAAAEALGHIGRGSAGDAVRKALRADASLIVRTAAAESLGTLGGSEAVDHLTAALSRDAEWRVRRAAAEACGFLQDSQAVHTLQHAADDSHFRVRMAVAWALGEIGTDEARDTLSFLSRGDRSSLVRRSALRARDRVTA